MFVVNKETNRITKIQSKSFSELGFKEREHLQEWLANNTDVFGEELLIIQKEFDGFDDTRERLDLLAIDKQGNIVVIENKLDDSGRDVTWQVLKYASYCSSLSKKQIKEIYQSYLRKNGLDDSSEVNIAEFLNADDLSEVQLNQNQRIILVSANYRKEVTSTVLWLLTKYNLKIQCFKSTPFSFNDQILLNVEQIIPVKEVEEFTIKMAEKAQEDINTQDVLKTSHKFRLEFWKELIPKYNTISDLFSNISPSKDSWISAGSGVTGISFNFVVSKNYARTEVYCSRSVTEENKYLFDTIINNKAKIESITGELEWERLDTKKGCRIKNEQNNVTLYEKDDWPKMMEFMCDSMKKFEEAFKPEIMKASQKLKNEYSM